MDNLTYPYVANIDDRIIPVPNEVTVYTVALPKNIVVLSSKTSATIRIDGEDVATLYPFSHGYRLVQGDRESAFRVGDCIEIGGVSIEHRPKQFKLYRVDGKELDFDRLHLLEEPYKPEYPAGFPEYRRSPRIIKPIPKDKITIAKPEAVPTAEKSQLIKAILPPVVMVGMGGIMSLVSGGNPIMMLGMASMSVVTAGITVASFVTKKKEIKSKKIERVEKYDVYLLDKQASLNHLESQERETLLYHYPDGNTLIQLATEYSSRIYEKTSYHGDFLTFSLGTGQAPTTFTIDFSREELKSDPLIDYVDKEIIGTRSALHDVPIITSLLGETIGLAGSYPILRNAISNLLLQIATFHSYRDVQFVTLVPEENYEKDWSIWRWLPHVQIEALNMRGFVHHMRSRDVTLSSFYQLMNKRKQIIKEVVSSEKPNFTPHYILTILDDGHLAGHGLNEYLAEDMSQYGVTVIWCKDYPEMLPETVTTLVRYYSNQLGELVNEKGMYVRKEFIPHALPAELDTAITHLANLQHVEVEKNAIPKSVTFLEMYNVKKVEELDVAKRWSKANTAKTLAVPLGLRGKNDIVELNLHERAHGPHGLVAGTTGSGKSEIVQSYILSLALNFAPEDVGFLPIDFKGGGMANEFKGLPHLLGSITNLDGASSARALASIQAELKKRQHMFAEYGVNHINAYTKLYKQCKEGMDPIPHLFLISDEFAELKANEPEFMAELVSVARIGRSLGVHLILATQKPSGVVDDQIWSNSRFKLALKVADENDSNEIIKTPDAASIVEPGRAYLQVGNNEIFELFQSAWSGATYDPHTMYEEKVDERIWLINDLGQHQLLTQDLSEDEVPMLDRSEEELPTQLRAITNHIAAVCKEEQVILPPKPWLPPLQDTIVTPRIDCQITWSKPRCLSIPLALMDIPSKQLQETYHFDLEKTSHTIIYGSAGYGKSTVLQTLALNLARQNNPEQIQMNLLDFGTNGLLMLKELPHVIDLARLDEEEKLIKLLKRIQDEVSHRKELFSENGVSSLSQYEAKTGKALPVILTLVDCYDSLRESPQEELTERVMNSLLREGASIGMYVIMTGLRADTLKIAMTSNIPTSIGLFLVEDNAIKNIVGRDALIAEEIVGRGQIKLDQPIAVQFYLPAEGENDLERLHAIELEVNEMSLSWTGKRPNSIPMVPKTLTEHEFYEKADVQIWLANGWIPLGLNMENVDVIGYNPIEHSYFLIADGDPMQTEYLERMILHNMKYMPGIRICLDGQDRFEQHTDIFEEIISQADYATFVRNLLQTIDNRQDLIGEELEPLYVYIPDAQGFTNWSSIDEESMVKLLRHAAKVGIYLLFHGDKAKFDSCYDAAARSLRSTPPAGMVGTKLSNQDFVPVKSDYKEPILEMDEHHWFSKRTVVKVKLVT